MRVAVVTMETCLLFFCACADNHVTLLFINKVGGSRRGLSIRLSGIFTYPACFWKQGVRIIEVLLYRPVLSEPGFVVIVSDNGMHMDLCGSSRWQAQTSINLKCWFLELALGISKKKR